MSPQTQIASFPKKLALGITALSFTLLVLCALLSYSTYKAIRTNSDKTETIAQLQTQIDENFHLLMESSKLAAYSGQISYETRYFETTPLLSLDIESIANHFQANSNLKLLREELIGNLKKLEELDNKSFDLIREKNNSSALKILYSTEYEQHSLAVTQTYSLFSQEVKNEFQRMQSANRRASLLVFGINILLIPLTSLLAYGFFRTLKNWEHSLSISNQQLQTAVEQALLQEKHAQQISIQSSRMASLGQMAGGIAHEINNPLAIIQGKTALLKQQIQKDKFEKDSFIKNLEKIELMIKRVTKIIAGLKTFSRDGSHDPMLPTSLQTLIENSLELCQKKITNSNIQLQIEDIPKIEFFCRETQISQVLINLISNAVDAIENLSEKWITLSFKQVEGGITITVTDSGGGIPISIQNKLMEPFFTTKDVGKGTGLGLSISKGIIEAHGGRLTIDNNCPNTRFIMYLPYSVSEEQVCKLAG